MSHKSFWGLGSVAAAIMMVAGCQTLQPVSPPDVREVRPERFETIIVDQVIILADTSSSMQRQSSYPEMKAFLRGFVTAMPSGTYEVAAGNFGGPSPGDWHLLPFSWLDRPAIGEFADTLTQIGGTTDMERWLPTWQRDLSVREGRAALIVLSDGGAPMAETLLATEALAAAYPGQLCVYTVRFGDIPEGEWLLREMSRVARCGHAWNHEQVVSPDDLERMVRHIFFGDLPDSDGDGVPDIYDECPDTPRGAKVDERGCWVIEGVLFDFDRSDIRAEAHPILDEVAAVLQMNPGVRVRIEGHTDSRGSLAYNQGLSERRAASVVRALVDRGISEWRLESVGYGETRPIRPNDTEANMQLNRRVEITPIQ